MLIKINKDFINKDQSLYIDDKTMNFWTVENILDLKKKYKLIL